ncbi:molybdopterin-dependent oxidoreductase [Shewanella sp. D64]|uniref:DMSO/selenate family reductase complex A subunit n=1 Tax=unclassified Shewanella TaxID=196818 RepID=UPI0022BA574C|nr:MULTISPECIES: DMSO/selenate family reductase complex A subunit [unclassified Shewanella]MEC4728663.1 molybdopterin-dependent oxidoreductase [Shewanella sp. D64]MEC4740574.1 molybdopterin-dependent oxidoreductase [Shewanella sp. E94]WBJ95117.1 molybdopterin-dependent oxidoreductase [Shewanella sp. MTB7]
MERRSFLKASAALGCAATVVGCKTDSDEVNVVPPQPPLTEEQMNWSSCTCNCAASCALKVISQDGVVTRVESDNLGTDKGVELQSRACLRGRASRQKIYANDRLKVPMKRVGKRGEGKFIPISWDEAYSTIASELRRVIDTYGNDAIYWQYASGTNQFRAGGRESSKRLLNLLGGFLDMYGSYSAAQIAPASVYTFGDMSSSAYKQMNNSDLILSFGFNPSETRMSGSGGGLDYSLACQQVEAIIVDPRYSESALGKEHTWLAIRPGTDAALCEALAYQLISQNQHDQAFLDKYCVGFDEKTLPTSAPANADYKSYILGNSDDGIAKTPKWAAEITGIPELNIIKLADKLAAANAPYITQGWGPQRQANGEQTSRAIFMLPLLVGKLGIAGTNNGNWPRHAHSLGAMPIGTNSIKAKIPCFMWTEAITNGVNMTAVEHGVQGVEKLENSIKFIWNYAGNTMINQHSDTFGTAKILEDESLCEFILVHDVQMTPSAMYADILLPDVMDLEQHDIVANPGTDMETIIAMTSSVKPPFDVKSCFEVCLELAKRMGVEDGFTEGRSYQQWVEFVYESSRKRNPALPTYQEVIEQGLVKVSQSGEGIVMDKFIASPVENALNTPSGKIEIYSERLAQMSENWVLPEGDIISAIPKFCDTWEGARDTVTQEKYPLQMIGHHTKGRTHSSFHNIPWLREAVEDAVWMNPIDADSRGLKSGDTVIVNSKRGSVRTVTKVTPRIMPGVTSLPQGAWFKPENGVDIGGNINSITSLRPSPLAKGNPQHTNLVQIKKA